MISGPVHLSTDIAQIALSIDAFPRFTATCTEKFVKLFYLSKFTMDFLKHHRRRWVRPVSQAMGQFGLVALLLPSIVLPATATTTRPATATPPAATPGAASAGASSASDEYILGPGDRLQLDFFSVPEFSKEYQVLPNGTLNLPRVGGVSVQGLTVRQATANIASSFSRYLTRPLVTVSLIAGRSVNVAIAGEINRPGAYTMGSALVNGVNAPDTPTLTKLVRLAEGITLSSDLANVRVQRRQADGIRTYRVNLWQLMRSGDAAQDIRLQDGDSIYIPVTTNLDPAIIRERTRINIATSSNRPLRIAIVGEVNRPGPYTIFEGAQQADNRTATPNSVAPSITKALQVSGGITQMADLRNIQVRRLTHTGQEQLIPVDFWKLLQSGDTLQDLPLQDGDRIEVARATTTINNAELLLAASSPLSPDRIAINIVGEVIRPGGVEVAPNTPMNQGILAAGGFNNRAKKSVVTLVRLEPNGTVSKRDINVDLASGIDEAGNPPLRKGDTIIVKKNGLAIIGESIGTLTNPIGGAFSLLRLLGIIR
jgi:polysaccharide biosynthesis/export protein